MLSNAPLAFWFFCAALVGFTVLLRRRAHLRRSGAVSTRVPGGRNPP
jgi:hypothetical protein